MPVLTSTWLVWGNQSRLSGIIATSLRGHYLELQFSSWIDLGEARLVAGPQFVDSGEPGSFRSLLATSCRLRFLDLRRSSWVDLGGPQS